MPISQHARTVVGLTGELGRTLRQFRREAAVHRPKPPEQGFVLDIGAGHAPHPRSDVVVDKYVVDDFERESGLAVTKPLVVGDGHALPFASATFAYSIASHVLEHATDVPAFAGELARVSPAGFVQVPSRESELTFGWPFHPWLIDLDDGVLVFVPRGDAMAPVGPLFHTAASESKLFTLWFGANRSVWHHTVHWTGIVPVRVGGPFASGQTADLDVERTLAVLPRMRATGPVGALREALRCPSDHGVLREKSSRLTCTDCGRSYPVAGTVPVLLDEAAR
jgi:Methyltransferase domain